MPILDIILIVFLILGALIGAWRGFFKSIISFFGWIVSVLIAIIFAQLVAQMLMDISMVNQLVLGGYGHEWWSLAGWVESWLPYGLQNVPAYQAGNEYLIGEALGGNWWSFLVVPLIPMLTGAVAADSGLMVSQLIGMTIAHNIFVIAVAIALVIAIRVLMIVFSKIVDALRKNKKLRAIDRLGGFGVGIAKHSLYIFVVLFALSYVLGSPFMAPVRNQIDNTVLTRQVNNITMRITDRYFRGDDNFLQRILDTAGWTNRDDAEQNGQTNYNGYYNSAGAANGVRVLSGGGQSVIFGIDCVTVLLQ